MPETLLINLVEGSRTRCCRQKSSKRWVRIAHYANTIPRVVLAAAADAFEVLGQTGRTDELASRILSWDVRQNLVDLSGWIELDANIAAAGAILRPDQ